MKKIYRERLRKLARMLVADSKRKKGIQFDLNTVGEASGNVINSFDSEDDWTPGLNCGTTACAMGLAAISGEFKRAGLTYEVSGGFIGTVYKGNTCSYIHAATKTFGLTNQEAYNLFSPNAYPPLKRRGAIGERLVADRIREVIKVNTPKKKRTTKK